MTREVADVIGLSTRATRTRLSKLVGRELAVAISIGPWDPNRKYLKAKMVSSSSCDDRPYCVYWGPEFEGAQP